MGKVLKGSSEHTQAGLGSDIECLKAEYFSSFFNALFVSVSRMEMHLI